MLICVDALILIICLCVLMNRAVIYYATVLVICKIIFSSKQNLDSCMTVRATRHYYPIFHHRLVLVNQHVSFIGINHWAHNVA